MGGVSIEIAGGLRYLRYMGFIEKTVKGVKRCLVDTNLKGEPMHYHISEVGPGGRSHPPHQHPGCEAIHVLAGSATLELGDHRQILNEGEGVIFDPTQMHGLINHGTTPVRYMVILRRQD